MSLVSPEIIDVSQEGEDGKLACEALATPENLSHNYILVPAKLRLVTLAAFILSKCKVRLWEAVRFLLYCSASYLCSVLNLFRLAPFFRFEFFSFFLLAALK